MATRFDPTLESLEDLLLLEQTNEDALEEGESLEEWAMRYAADEEIGCAEKEHEHDRHRWELDPASAEDWRERRRTLPLASPWRRFSFL